MIVVVGLSHRTAPIAVRERLAIVDESVPDLLRECVSEEPVREALLVSTCNRVELVVAGRADASVSDLGRVASRALATRAPGIERHLYAHEADAAVRHLFRVAASLDSLVVGEPQILGQVKHAFEVAREAGTVGALLNAAIPRAVRAAKRARTETAIAQGQVSVPSVAVDLARQIFGDLTGRSAALVGSGEMAETVARLLAQAGAKLTVIGRNAARTSEIAGALGARSARLEDLQAMLAEVDVLVGSTTSRVPLVTVDAVQRARRTRRGRNLFLIDLAVPRDIDPRVDSVDGVFLYNVDDLSRVVEGSLAGRDLEAARAEDIVLHEMAGWDRWVEALGVTPAIVMLRDRFRRVLEGELERSLRGRLKHLGPEEREALEAMVEAALNKLLHEPSSRLRQLGDDARPALAIMADLFALDAADADAAKTGTGSR